MLFNNLLQSRRIMHFHPVHQFSHLQHLLIMSVVD